MKSLITVVLLIVPLFLVTTVQAEEHASIQILKHDLALVMKDASSTKYKAVTTYRDGALVCGLMDTKNSYGAYTGFQPFYAFVSHTAILKIEYPADAFMFRSMCKEAEVKEADKAVQKKVDEKTKTAMAVCENVRQSGSTCTVDSDEETLTIVSDKAVLSSARLCDIMTGNKGYVGWTINIIQGTDKATCKIS